MHVEAEAVADDNTSFCDSGSSNGSPPPASRGYVRPPVQRPEPGKPQSCGPRIDKDIKIIYFPGLVRNEVLQLEVNEGIGRLNVLGRDLEYLSITLSLASQRFERAREVRRAGGPRWGGGAFSFSQNCI